jgi:predicted RNA-binding protein YlqC (UPF0109 family)
VDAQSFAPLALEYLKFILTELVDDPTALVIEAKLGPKTINFEVRCAKADVGRLLGKNGANINAVRTLLKTLCGKYKQNMVVNVIDDGAPHGKR